MPLYGREEAGARHLDSTERLAVLPVDDRDLRYFDTHTRRCVAGRVGGHPVAVELRGYLCFEAASSRER